MHLSGTGTPASVMRITLCSSSQGPSKLSHVPGPYCAAHSWWFGCSLPQKFLHCLDFQDHIIAQGHKGLAGICKHSCHHVVSHAAEARRHMMQCFPRPPACIYQSPLLDIIPGLSTAWQACQAHVHLIYRSQPCISRRHRHVC